MCFDLFFSLRTLAVNSCFRFFPPGTEFNHKRIPLQNRHRLDNTTNWYLFKVFAPWEIYDIYICWKIYRISSVPWPTWSSGEIRGTIQQKSCRNCCIRRIKKKKFTGILAAQYVRLSSVSSQHQTYFNKVSWSFKFDIQYSIICEGHTEEKSHSSHRKLASFPVLSFLQSLSFPPSVWRHPVTLHPVAKQHVLLAFFLTLPSPIP